MRGTPRGIAEIWKILREVDLAQVRAVADRHFSLLVVGETGPAEALARALSQRPGGVGIHPWLRVVRLPLEADWLTSRPDASLIVTDEPELDAARRTALAELEACGIPVVTVVCGRGTHVVGAGPVREGEHARALVAEEADTPGLVRALLPALVAAMAPTTPDVALSLGRQLPVFRDAVIAELVADTARANAVYAFTSGLGEMVPALTVPLVIGDTVILTKNQLLMAFKIALVAGKRGEARELMGEVASVIGGGLLFRQIARELVGLIPVIGIVPKVAVAYAGTWAIGATVRVWAVEDRHPTAQEVRRFYRTAMARGRLVARQLVGRARRARTALPPPAPGREGDGWRGPTLAQPGR